MTSYWRHEHVVHTYDIRVCVRCDVEEWQHHENNSLLYYFFGSSLAICILEHPEYYVTVAL